MSNTEKQKVPFDPGYSEFVIGFPNDACKYLDEISLLKQNHQKKFAFANLENQITPVIKNLAAFYLGCILWGSYLFWNYKEAPREIEGNYVLSLSEEEKAKINKDEELEYVLEFLNKFEKASKYYLNRSSKIPSEYAKYFEAYRKFVQLNDNFKSLKYTDEIKLPEETAHFESFSKEKLEELKNKIYEIINSEKLESLLNLGFYS